MKKPHPSKRQSPTRPRPRPPAAPPPAAPFAEGYKVNDPVEVAGNLDANALRRLRINGAPPIYLGKRAYLVLLVLACHQLTQQGRPAPFSIPGPAFLSAAAILLAIDKIAAAAGASLSVLVNGTSDDVNRIVYLIRTKLRRLRLNDALIESGPPGTGYRLSIPPGHATVTMTPASGPPPGPGAARAGQ
jgi:hypothetical protein